MINLVIILCDTLLVSLFFNYNIVSEHVERFEVGVGAPPETNRVKLVHFRILEHRESLSLK